jgi:hypothetical protein
VTVEGDGDFVARAAANAQSGVCCVGRQLHPEGWITDAKVGGVRTTQTQRRNQWVICIENESGCIRQILQAVTPGLVNEVNFPVAIELVPKDVREQYDSRAKLGCRGRERRLVYFEEADVSHWFAIQRRLAHNCADQPRDQVGAGPVVERSQPVRLKQMGDQASGSRFPIRPGDHDRAVPQSAYNGR